MGKKTLIAQLNQSHLNVSESLASWSKEQRKEQKMNLKEQCKIAYTTPTSYHKQNSFQVYSQSKRDRYADNNIKYLQYQCKKRFLNDQL